MKKGIVFAKRVSDDGTESPISAIQHEKWHQPNIAKNIVHYFSQKKHWTRVNTQNEDEIDKVTINTLNSIIRNKQGLIHADQEQLKGYRKEQCANVFKFIGMLLLSLITTPLILLLAASFTGSLAIGLDGCFGVFMGAVFFITLGADLLIGAWGVCANMWQETHHLGQNIKETNTNIRNLKANRGNLTDYKKAQRYCQQFLKRHQGKREDTEETLKQIPIPTLVNLLTQPSRPADLIANTREHTLNGIPTATVS